MGMDGASGAGGAGRTTPTNQIHTTEESKVELGTTARNVTTANKVVSNNNFDGSLAPLRGRVESSLSNLSEKGKAIANQINAASLLCFPPKTPNNA